MLHSLEMKIYIKAVTVAVPFQEVLAQYVKCKYL